MALVLANQLPSDEPTELHEMLYFNYISSMKYICLYLIQEIFE